MQQNGSLAQILSEQGPHSGASGGPMTQVSCEQPAWPQKPPVQTPLQQSWAPLQATPSGAHTFWQTPPLQTPEQQSWGPPQPEPIGWQELQSMPHTFTTVATQPGSQP